MKLIDLIEVYESGKNRWTLTLWSGMTMVSESEYLSFAGALLAIPANVLSFRSTLIQQTEHGISFTAVKG